MFHIVSMTENEFIKKVGENIVRARKEKKLTQAELAAMLDMESSSLRRIENGRTNTTLKMLFKICNVLEINIVELVKDL